MKTRTNQVIAMLVVASMVALTTSQINTLSAGDIVLKQDDSGYHAYLVSYKKDGTGICLTYTDASCVETVSYDLTDGEWVYNSTDITHLVDKSVVDGKQDELESGVNIKTINGESILGDGNINVSSSLYLHNINVSGAKIVLTLKQATAFNLTTFAKWLNDNGFTSTSPLHCYSGVEDASSKVMLWTGLYSDNGTTITMKYDMFNTSLSITHGTASPTSLTDNVVEL